MCRCTSPSREVLLCISCGWQTKDILIPPAKTTGHLMNGPIFPLLVCLKIALGLARNISKLSLGCQKYLHTMRLILHTHHGAHSVGHGTYLLILQKSTIATGIQKWFSTDVLNLWYLYHWWYLSPPQRWYSEESLPLYFNIMVVLGETDTLWGGTWCKKGWEPLC